MLQNFKAENFILMCDSYKVQHRQEYPQDTKYLYSTIVPRKGKKYGNEIVAMGQTYLAKYLESVRITMEMIDEAQEEIEAQGYDFNRADWEYIVKEHGGALPLAMYGVEEGRVVGEQTPIVGFVNNDEECAWLVSYTETIAQSLIWKMTTVASKCRYLYKAIKAAIEATGGNMAMLEYMLHNFGDRGASSPDEAVRAAIAHAAFFSGSDCLNANRYIKVLYNTTKNYLSSVEATEHSVMCSWSNAELRDDYEAAVMAVNRLDAVVERTKRGIGIPLMSVVIDTYDDERFVSEYLGTKLKDRIVNSGGRLVARPDTGNPVVKPIEIIKLLMAKFGYTNNDKGFGNLPGYIGVIQGDGIDEISLPKILLNLISENLCTDNLVFGMGGGLTHNDKRDDLSFSMKATARFNGVQWINLLKEPKSDLGKTSLTGLVRCYEGEEGIVVRRVTSGSSLEVTGPAWRLWYSNGFQVYSQTFDEVREYARMM